MAPTVLETWEVQQSQFIDNVIDIPLETQRQIPVVNTIQKIVETPQAQFIPAVTQRQSSRLRVQKAVQMSQIPAN